MEDDTELTLPVRFAEKKQSALTDQFRSLREHDRKGEPVTVVVERSRVQPQIDSRTYLGLVARAPRKVSADILARLDRVQRVVIIPAERTKEESVST